VSDYNIRLALSTMQQHLTDMQANLTKLSAYLDKLDKAEEAEDEVELLFFVDETGLEVYHVLHAGCLADFRYTVDPENSDIDEDDGSGTMFDVRDIPNSEGLPAASTMEPVAGSGGKSSMEQTGGRDAHAALIRYAIKQGWLRFTGLNLPPEAA
jgi:hypothetical protein